MNKAKIESQREKYYLKYKKSSIFDPSPNNTTKNEKYKITDKITNKNNPKKFKPKEDIITSRQRYINSLYKNDLTDLTFTPKKKRSKIRRMKSNSSLNKNNNNNASFSHPLTEKKEISMKRKMSFFRESSVNDEKAIKILRTTRNHKLRSFLSKTSDIFNTHNTSTNSMKNDKKCEKNKNNENLNKTSDNIRKIKPISLNMGKMRNTKNFFLRELTSKNNTIRSEREKEELLRKKVNSKFSKLNVKLKKVDDNHSRKKTDLISTPKSGKKIRVKK